MPFDWRLDFGTHYADIKTDKIITLLLQRVHLLPSGLAVNTSNNAGEIKGGFVAGPLSSVFIFIE